VAVEDESVLMQFAGARGDGWLGGHGGGQKKGCDYCFHQSI
jgi:hypothetical protein